MRLAVPISALFTLCTVLFPLQVMQIFTADETLIAGGAAYLRAASPSYLFCGLSQIYLCIMKNCGMAKEGTLISSLCVVFDGIMNIVLILGLFGLSRMGILGAALSTSIARGVEALFMILALMRSKKISLRMKYLFHTEKGLHRDFWKYTLPVLANELVWGIGFTMTSVIMGHLVNDATAANSIAGITKNLVVCFGSGGGIMVGNELGAGNFERAKEYSGKLCRLSVIYGIISGLVILLLTPLILHFVPISETSIKYLGWMLVICSYYMIGKSVNCTTIAGIFCAGADTRFGFLCDTIVMWGIIVPLGLIAAFVLKLPVIAVYFFLCLDEFLKIPAVYRHYKKYSWVKDLTVKEHE